MKQDEARDAAFNTAVVEGAKLEDEHGPMTALQNMFDAGVNFGALKTRTDTLKQVAEDLRDLGGREFCDGREWGSLLEVIEKFEQEVNTDGKN